MKERYAVHRLCGIMEVTRSSYYRWRLNQGLDNRGEDEVLLEAIRGLRGNRRKRCYGSRRLVSSLRELGFVIGRKRVRRLMRQGSIVVQRRKAFRPQTTNSNHTDPIAPNRLQRKFQVEAPNQVWAGDITYLRCGSGWLYLAVVIDLYSRRVIGWSIQKSLHRRLVIQALHMAIGRRSSALGVIFHSDRGSQYASADFRQLLAANKIIASMSGKGDCWDNAPVESFFSTLKKEAMLNGVMSASMIRSEVFEYIEVFYNRQRIHSTLGGVSPEKFEMFNNQFSVLCA